MDHLAEPLEALRARALAWLRDERARVLAVAADPELAEGAGALLASLEWAPDNQRAFFALAAPGWAARGAELRQVYEARRTTFAGEGLPLPALPAAAGSAPPLAAFARDLAVVARAFDDPEIGTRGVVVLLAVDAQFEARALVAAPGLERVRWIWLGTAAEPAQPGGGTGVGVGAGAGAGAGPDADPSVRFAQCRIDRAARERETGDLLAATVAAVARGGGGPPGGARPSQAPPPHPGDPGATAAGGSPPPPAPPPHLHPLLLGIQALRAAELDLAMRRFGEARDAAAAMGAASVEEAAEIEIMLASTGARLAQERGTPFHQLLPLFDAAATRAEGAGLFAVAAKARFLLGVSAGAAGEIEIAARALLAAADLAGRGGAAALRFHALRVAGELAGQAGLHARAVELGREAVDLVRQMDPGEARASGLAETAAAKTEDVSP